MKLDLIVAVREAQAVEVREGDMYLGTWCPDCMVGAKLAVVQGEALFGDEGADLTAPWRHRAVPVVPEDGEWCMSCALAGHPKVWRNGRWAPATDTDYVASEVRRILLTARAT